MGRRLFSLHFLVSLSSGTTAVVLLPLLFQSPDWTTDEPSTCIDTQKQEVGRPRSEQASDPTRRPQTPNPPRARRGRYSDPHRCYEQRRRPRPPRRRRRRRRLPRSRRSSRPRRLSRPPQPPVQNRPVLRVLGGRWDHHVHQRAKPLSEPIPPHVKHCLRHGWREPASAVHGCGRYAMDGASGGSPRGHSRAHDRSISRNTLGSQSKVIIALLVVLVREMPYLCTCM